MRPCFKEGDFSVSFWQEKQNIILMSILPPKRLSIKSTNLNLWIFKKSRVIDFFSFVKTRKNKVCGYYFSLEKLLQSILSNCACSESNYNHNLVLHTMDNAPSLFLLISIFLIVPFVSGLFWPTRLGKTKILKYFGIRDICGRKLKQKYDR